MSFTSRDSASLFLVNYNPKAVASDIPEYFVTAADDEINQRSNTQWEKDSVDKTFLLDGTGTQEIHVPIIPIISLIEVVIINNDETEKSLIISGATREIRFNAETGAIHRVKADNELIIEDDNVLTSKFPIGIANIRVVGKFGRSEVLDLLRFLANLIILRMMSRFDPVNYKPNIISEKIGKYQYTLAHIDRATEGNEPLTIDGNINYLFSILPQDDSIFIEAV